MIFEKLKVGVVTISDLDFESTFVKLSVDVRTVVGNVFHQEKDNQGYQPHEILKKLTCGSNQKNVSVLA